MSSDFEIERWVPGGMAESDVLHAGLIRKAAFYPEGRPSITPEDEAAAVAENVACWVEGVTEDRGLVFHALRRDGRLVTVAETFVRTVFVEDAPADDESGTTRRAVQVLALGGVATEASWRGRGFGAAVVRDAFGRLPELSLTHCLFQTGRARPLYERLGATRVANRFVNLSEATIEAREADPWSDDWVMRYPRDAPWFEGVIDLNGSEY